MESQPRKTEGELGDREEERGSRYLLHGTRGKGAKMGCAVKETFSFSV